MRRHGATAWLAIMATAAGLLLSSACQSDSSSRADSALPPRDPTLPKLSQMRSQVTPVQPPPAPPQAQRRRATIRAKRLLVPLNAPTDTAWAMTDETVLSTLMRGLWHANGLRLGVIPASDVRAFMESLPPILDIENIQIISTDDPAPLLAAPPLRRPVVVDLTVPPRSVREERIEGGRVQMLVRSMRDRRGQLYIELIPHHYKPEVSLLPRSPLEKMLDGRVFQELSVQLPVMPGQVIVLGLYRPWPASASQPQHQRPPASEAEAESREASSESSDRTASSSGGFVWPDPSLAPSLPPHLGQALWASSRAGSEVQALLIIEASSLNFMTAAGSMSPPPQAPPDAMVSP